jgi:xanthosine utilization system XapX-like protein
MSIKAYKIFLFLVLNGTWVGIAYLLHISGLSPKVIAIVVAVGVVLGNLAAYTGIKIAEKLVHKKRVISN